MKNVEVNKNITGVNNKKMIFDDQASVTDNQSEIPEVYDHQKLRVNQSKENFRIMSAGKHHKLQQNLRGSI